MNGSLPLGEMIKRQKHERKEFYEEGMAKSKTYFRITARHRYNSRHSRYGF